jgi:hypothetical protein
MVFQPKESRERLRLLIARAEQAELAASRSEEPSARGSWTTIAQMWRLLAENSGRAHSGNAAEQRDVSPDEFAPQQTPGRARAAQSKER